MANPSQSLVEAYRAQAFTGASAGLRTFLAGVDESPSEVSSMHFIAAVGEYDPNDYSHLEAKLVAGTLGTLAIDYYRLETAGPVGRTMARLNLAATWLGSRVLFDKTTREALESGIAKDVARAAASSSLRP